MILDAILIDDDPLVHAMWEFSACKHNKQLKMFSRKLNTRAILVISSFEDMIVRNRCKTLGIKIIPKSFVPYIPIIMIPNN